jgi:hypothetical protein
MRVGASVGFPFAAGWVPRGIAAVGGRVVCLFVLGTLLSSCTFLAQSPHLKQTTEVPVLDRETRLVAAPDGTIPYQRWRIPSWDDDLRYVWVVGNHNFRNADKLELILFFHGMHSSDYYASFKKELLALAAKRPDHPFVFVGFVDTPCLTPEERSRERWVTLAPKPGERPDRLLETVNRVFRAVRLQFPNIRKDKTTIALAGFSGGGRVLNSVGCWLAKNSAEDPYAEIFKARLSKLAYFDCWFERDVAQTIPTLLESNPRMKIVGTVHMKTPVLNAVLLASKYKMKGNKQKRELVGLDGRLVIFRNDSHWEAMIMRLAEAL